MVIYNEVITATEAEAIDGTLQRKLDAFTANHPDRKVTGMTTLGSSVVVTVSHSGRRVR